jgi:hypothetical protein
MNGMVKTEIITPLQGLRIVVIIVTRAIGPGYQIPARWALDFKQSPK